MKTLQDYIDKLKALNFKEMYEGDFFLTWGRQTTSWKLSGLLLMLSVT